MEFGKLIQEYAQVFLDAGIGREGRGAIVVRCGEHGCLTMTKNEAFWLPSSYEATSPQIVDTTGAGNAFLGGFTVGLQTTGDLREAAILGTVAASFALEQISLPQHMAALTPSAEMWNGARVASRIAEFKERLQSSRDGGGAQSQVISSKGKWDADIMYAIYDPANTSL